MKLKLQGKESPYPGDWEMLLYKDLAFLRNFTIFVLNFVESQGRGASEWGTPREWDGGGARRRAGQHD